MEIKEQSGLRAVLQDVEIPQVYVVRQHFERDGIPDIGILPGIGGGVSCMISYTVSKNTSKHRELYGTGIMDGVVASETANNATIGGAMIPLLSLGIPGDAATAMLLGGLQVHNVAPGPLIYQNNGVVVYAIFFAMVVAAIFMLFFMLLGMRFFVRVLKVPKNYLLTVVWSCAASAPSARPTWFLIPMLWWHLV